MKVMTAVPYDTHEKKDLLKFLYQLFVSLRTSPAQFVFYLLTSLCGGVTLRTIIKRQYEEDQYEVWQVDG